MPTSAATGTRNVKTAGAKNEAKKADKKDESVPVRELVGPQPLADPNGNGTIQVTAPDGSITNVSAEQDGWEKQVKDIDPKHWSVR